MWNTIKLNTINELIKEASNCFIAGDKDGFVEILAKVGEDTGYEIDLIYDIFVEQIEDEAEDNADIGDAIYRAADYTISVAYEQDL